MNSHKVLRIPSPDVNLQDRLSRELGISSVLAQVLLNRGLNSADEAEKFLNPEVKDFLDPYSFSDMHKAVSLIRKAVKNKDRVMVFGDYDADGITALTLLKATLVKMGLDVIHYLPHRIKEGYGLTHNVLHLAREKNIKLLITVDCGTRNHKEIWELDIFF